MFKSRSAALLLSTLSLLPSCAPTLSGPPRPVTASTDRCAASVAPAGLVVTSAELVPAGKETPRGAAAALPEHCLIRGKVNERTSPVDGKKYAISFEMRLPTHWNGRYYYQVNGGNDGAVVPAYGGVLGGGSRTNALTQGFAVISSDGGHAAEQVPGVGGQLFGLDPQARLDYGYSAIGTLAPLGKKLIRAYYGQGPARSYMAGCSNGGRGGLVTAARYPDEFDGILVGAPGFNLPKAAVAQMWDAQAFAAVAPKNAQGQPDFAASLTPDDLNYVRSVLLDKADALDGLKDGIIQNTAAAQKAFNVETDLPNLSPEKRAALAKVFSGAKNSKGESLYADWPFDPGIAGAGWRIWKLNAGPGPSLALALGAPSMAYIFTTPPTRLTADDLATYTLNYNFDTDAAKIYATDPTYTVSPMNFMTPPNATDLGGFSRSGGKMLVFHGVSDPVFSVNDTVGWFNAVGQTAAARDVAFYAVPGMNHCSGGPATDQADFLTPLVNWVENGVKPGPIVAQARGEGNLSVNADLPRDWAADRTRPLCPYPAVATYGGSGDPEKAESFTCKLP